MGGREGRCGLGEHEGMEVGIWCGQAPEWNDWTYSNTLPSSSAINTSSCGDCTAVGSAVCTAAGACGGESVKAKAAGCGSEGAASGMMCARARAGRTAAVMSVKRIV